MCTKLINLATNQVKLPSGSGFSDLETSSHKLLLYLVFHVVHGAHKFAQLGELHASHDLLQADNHKCL